MAWLQAIDGGKVAYISLHDPRVHHRWPQLSFDQLMKQLYLIDRSGTPHGGAAAFRFLSRKLIPLWPLAPLLHIPGSLPIWQYLYRQIARVRYRFGRVEACEGDACSVHVGSKS